MIPELSGDFLQWLRGFYYVAKTGSVRNASEILNKTPSTVSYQLKCLENDLGTVLFDRYKKSLIITSDGKRLLDWTITTFETLQGMRASWEHPMNICRARYSLALLYQWQSWQLRS